MQIFALHLFEHGYLIVLFFFTLFKFKGGILHGKVKGTVSWIISGPS